MSDIQFLPSLKHKNTFESYFFFFLHIPNTLLCVTFVKSKWAFNLLLRSYHWEPNHFNPINMTEEKSKIIMALIFQQNVVSFVRYSLKENSTLCCKKKRKDDQWIKVLVAKPSDLNLITRTHRVGRKNPWP